MSELKEISVDNFDENVLQGDKTVLVDFFAEWCGPCKVLGPVLEEIASEHSDDVTIVKVDVDKAQELAQKYGIRGMPTMLFFKGGELKSTLVGNQPKQTILKSIDELK